MYIWMIVLNIMVIVGIWMMVKIQQRTREQMLVQLRARDHAQEAHQQEWKAQQEKRLNQVEQRLMAQMHTLLEDVHTKEVQDSRRIDDLTRQYEAAVSQAHLEYITRGSGEEEPTTVSARGRPFWPRSLSSLSQSRQLTERTSCQGQFIYDRFLRCQSGWS